MLSDQDRDLVQRACRVGLVVAVDGDVLALGTTGRRRGGEPEPVTEQTPMAWASVTKTVTGTLLAALVLDGTVRLEQTVSDLLPGAPPVTLEALATHRSGLPRLVPGIRAASARVSADDPYGGETEAALLSALQRTRLRRWRRYRYSNAGFGLLGLALARAAGTTYEALVQELVAGPLSLTTLTCRVPPELAVPHDGAGPVRPWSFAEGAQGCGALSGSLLDLDRWLLAATGDAPGPLAEALGLATRPRARASVFGGSTGLGWHVGIPAVSGAGDVVWHDGALAGTGSFVGAVPTGSGWRRVAALANHEGGLDRLAETLLLPAPV